MLVERYYHFITIAVFANIRHFIPVRIYSVYADKLCGTNGDDAFTQRHHQSTNEH